MRGPSARFGDPGRPVAPFSEWIFGAATPNRPNFAIRSVAMTARPGGDHRSNHVVAVENRDRFRGIRTGATIDRVRAAPVPAVAHSSPATGPPGPYPAEANALTRPCCLLLSLKSGLCGKDQCRHEGQPQDDFAPEICDEVAEHPERG